MGFYARPPRGRRLPRRLRPAARMTSDGKSTRYRLKL